MKYRKLRIAWSVGWGVLAVLLISLWVRSYWWSESIVGRAVPNVFFQIDSSPGTCWLTLSGFERPGTQWKLHRHSSDKLRSELVEMGYKSPSMVGEFAYKLGPIAGYYFISIGVPFWFAISLVVSAASAAWIRWRFSLRTLLIAATVTAVVLGLAVMMLRGS